MNRQVPSPELLDALAGALAGFLPGFTGRSLGEAIALWRQTSERGVSGDHLVPGKLLTIHEAAARLSCSKRTVWRLIAAHRLPSIRLGARSTRVPEAALVKLSEEGGGT